VHREFDTTSIIESDTRINLGLEWRVTPRLRITPRVSFAGEQNAARVGVRYYLPSRFERSRD
jgi:hypothetical protein